MHARNNYIPTAITAFYDTGTCVASVALTSKKIVVPKKSRNVSSKRQTLPQIVFFDNGKRWRKVKKISLALSVLFIPLFAGLFYAFSYSPFDARVNKEQAAVLDTKLESINTATKPVIDQGTFLQIDDTYGSYYVRRFGEHQKRVIVTFDDGPNPWNTMRILQVLKDHQVPATFFVIGNLVYKYPYVGHAILAQGSDMGLHTYSHAENKEDKKLNDLTFKKELDFSEKIFAATYGYKTNIFRIPYLGLEDKLSYNSLQFIKEAQKRGLVISAPTVDSQDWAFWFPQPIVSLATTSDVQTVVLLMHDAGGNRDATVRALPGIIAFYKSRGYTFTTVSEYARENNLVAKKPLSMKDKVLLPVVYHAYDIYKSSPRAIDQSFFWGFLLVILHVGIFIILAGYHTFKRLRTGHAFLEQSRRRKSLVSVVIPVHNEAKTIRHCVLAILKSSYSHLEVFIVDDGSTDDGIKTIADLCHDPRITVLSKQNGGKNSALNLALRHVRGHITIFIDADTRVMPQAIEQLVACFTDKKIGAVAGNIAVGNTKNILSRLQFLEYVINQQIEKRVTDLSNRVMVIPGAFGAWRTQVIKKAGGFADSTLAEDFDLSLQIAKRGYTTAFCERAIAITEVPTTLKQFYIQRYRWFYGNLQVYVKNRDMFFKRRYGLLGLLFLPRAVFLQIPSILLTPFVDILAVSSIVFGPRLLGIVYIVLYLVLLVMSVIIASRFGKVKGVNLLYVPLLRFPYTQFIYILFYLTILNALRGRLTSWRKLHHTGELTVAAE